MGDKKNIYTGGAAFPRPMGYAPLQAYNESQQGMTLRDWLAGQAVAGAAAQSMSAEDVASLAHRAYAVADAVLQARKG